MSSRQTWARLLWLTRWGIIGASLTLPAWSAPRASASTPEDLAQARAGFDKALALEAAKSWEAALAQFQQVAQVRATAAVRFHIARCLEQLGQWTEAIGAYELAMNDAQGPDREEIVRLATEASQKLRERLPSLTIEATPGAETVQVRLDGLEVRGSAYGAPRPLDPGRHELQVIDTDRQELHVLTLAPGEKQTFRLARLVPSSPPHPSAAAVSAAVSSDTAPKQVGRGTGPWLVVSGGAAGLVGAAVFWELARSKETELLDACYTPDLCPTSAKGIHDQGQRYTLAANVTGGVGLAAVAAGLIWWSWPQRSEPAAHNAARLRLAVAPGQIALGGQF